MFVSTEQWCRYGPSWHRGVQRGVGQGAPKTYTILQFMRIISDWIPFFC